MVTKRLGTVYFSHQRIRGSGYLVDAVSLNSDLSRHYPANRLPETEDVYFIYLS
jgi:hypothetical protein